MKVIITGSESFVAQELIKKLKNDKNFTIIGFDSIDVHSPTYEFHQVDIRNPEIHKLIPDDTATLIHLAAISRDVDCRGRSYECFDVNVMGTLNLINAASKKNVKQFIFASSEWVYEKFIGNEEKDEDSLIDISQHTSEYALSKLVSEINLRQKFQQGFNSITILRFGIIYGPRKNNWAAVESLMSAVKNQSEVKVGSLQNARRFIHVSDIATGIIKSIGLNGFHILNLTGDKLITLKDILEASQNILGKSIKIIETNPSQTNVRNPLNNRAKTTLNWSPEFNLEKGLRTILDFI